MVATTPLYPPPELDTEALHVPHAMGCEASAADRKSAAHLVVLRGGSARGPWRREDLLPAASGEKSASPCSRTAMASHSSSLTLVVVLACLVHAAPSSAAVDRASLSTFSNLVTISLSRHERFDVLSAADVRQVVALEAEKQAVGCESDASCLAEIAGAMGARLVVFGELGQLGSLYVLTLNLFDSDTASATGRVVLKGTTLESLAEQMDASIDRLVGKSLTEPASSAVKVLVLDLKPADGTALDAAPAEVVAVDDAPSAPVPWLLFGGGGVSALGLVGVLGGAALGTLGLLAETAAREATFQDETKAKLEEANGYGLGANVAFGVGGALVLVGAGIAALELFVGEAE